MTRIHSAFDSRDVHTQNMVLLHDNMYYNLYVEPYDDLEDAVTVKYRGESRQEQLANNLHYKLD